MRNIILTQLLISVTIFTFGCGSDNNVNIVNEVFAVEVTKLLTIQTEFRIDTLASGSAKTRVGKECPDGTVSIAGGCRVISFDGGDPVQSADSFLNQELQAFTCIIENNSQQRSSDVLALIQTLCSDLN